MMKPMEAIGSVPQAGVNPAAAAPQVQPAAFGQGKPSVPQDPRQEFGITDEDLDFFRHDPELIQAVQLITGRDFPMEQIDDALIVHLAGAVQKLGVQGAVAEAKRIIPPETMATIRGISMRQRLPRVGGQ